MTDLSNPLALFRAAVDAINAENWSAVAELIDPVSLRTFARQLRERYDAPEPRSFVTVEDYMQSELQLPREVAEYYAAEARRHADPAWRLRQEFPRVESVEALCALTPEGVFVHWIDARSMRRQVERLLAEGKISARAAEARSSFGYAWYNHMPIGVVADGDRIAHVLYRYGVDPDQPWSGDANWLANQPEDAQQLSRDLWGRGNPSVITCRRQSDGTWRFIVEHDFLHMGSMHITGVSTGDEQAPSELETPPS